MPDTKPIKELTIASATKRVIAIRRSIPDELAAAKQKVLDDAAAREAKVLERVHEEARGIVRREADKECPAENGITLADGPTEPDMSRATVTIDGAPVELPAGAREYRPGPAAKAARAGR